MSANLVSPLALPVLRLLTSVWLAMELRTLVSFLTTNAMKTALRVPCLVEMMKSPALTVKKMDVISVSTRIWKPACSAERVFTNTKVNVIPFVPMAIRLTPKDRRVQQPVYKTWATSTSPSSLLLLLSFWSAASAFWRRKAALLEARK